METTETLWNRIAKSNSEIELFKMVRKEKNKEGVWEEKIVEYAEVKERVIAFRKVYPNGAIITEPTFTENYIMVKASIYTDLCLVDTDGKEGWLVKNQKNALATGYARELGNRVFALENAETSAIGRALGFCGFGIKTSIASAEDMQDYDEQKNIFNEDTEAVKKRQEEAIKNFNKLSVKQQADILNVMHKSKVEDIELKLLEELIRNAK